MDLFTLLDDIQSIARNGLEFSQNPYDRERYTRLLNTSLKAYSDLLELPGEEIRDRFSKELGYITPKVGAEAAFFNDRGEILLMERADGSGWCLPCGWVETNEKPVEAIVREVREETGLEIEVRQLVGVFTRFPGAKNGPHTMIAVTHLCEVTGGTLTLSHEGSALRYWQIDEVPIWHTTHEQYARASHTMWKSLGTLPAISD
jgi:ADP-ribose pyrophosphatase YjhB (NUDIX family)